MRSDMVEMWYDKVAVWLRALRQGRSGYVCFGHTGEPFVHSPAMRLQSLMGRGKENLTCWFGSLIL